MPFLSAGKGGQIRLTVDWIQAPDALRGFLNTIGLVHILGNGFVELIDEASIVAGNGLIAT